MKSKKYYVTMTDKFMSGWGKAKDKTNKLVIECDTYEQAALIEKNAHRRSEMTYIDISCRNFDLIINYRRFWMRLFKTYELTIIYRKPRY